MRNPLMKSILRELKTDFAKYIVILIFMVLMIGVVSGMYVGHDSMIEAINQGVSNLNLEDGSFEFKDEASEELLDDLRTGKTTDIQIFENFYHNEKEDYDCDGKEDATVRIFKSDSKIDQALIIKGRGPEDEDEIAIDRMHGDNVGIEIGDSILVGGRKLQVVGFLSYVNYLTLHESNTDLMFDAFGFNVAMMTPKGFENLSSRMHYQYSYLYENKPEGKVQEADYAEELLEKLVTKTYENGNSLEEFLPEYLRQASNFAPSDIDGDTTGTGIMCYILIGVIAFIFAITIANTIEKDATIIGTLRASGYTKMELIIHYMSLPCIVTIMGAIIGNILGYTVFKDVAIGLYYESYSLPLPVETWSPYALVRTTVIPLVLMFFINLFVIVKRLQLSPLRLLRRDLKKTKRTRTIRIPSWSFIRRFRIRNILQNIPNYLVLIFGVVFVEVMLCFAFGLPDSLLSYADKASSMVFAPYQYVLTSNVDQNGAFIETKEDTAEKFSMTTLLYPKEDSAFREGFGSGGDEKVSVYGIMPQSKFLSIDEKYKEDEVAISSAFAKKYKLEKGDFITLKQEYEDESYLFTVGEVVDYDGGIAVFMPNQNFILNFDKDEGYYSGFFSKKEISDIDEKMIATVISIEDITKITTQLMHSMGNMVEFFKYILVILAAALIYLLTKIIIEKNQNSISMAKILGFDNKEIASLYIVPTAIIVVITSLISFVIGYYIMEYIFIIFVYAMDGWFPFYMKPISMVLSVVYLLVGYALVFVIDYFCVRKIPLTNALKNVD